jgi:hypothetical protein
MSNIHTITNDGVSVLGKDFTFPNAIDGLPVKLSDSADLFEARDGVRLNYWAAGSRRGGPLFVSQVAFRAAGPDSLLRQLPVARKFETNRFKLPATSAIYP